METHRRHVTLITGASSGIGAELARVFGRHGHDLALVARRGEILDRLADEIAYDNLRFGRRKPLVFAIDLGHPGAIDELALGLEAAHAVPENLVNCAGYGLAGPIVKLDPQEQLGMIDLNIRALTDLTLRFLPSVRASKGKILNVASIAAYLPAGPGFGIYSASKSYVLSFTLALAQELLKHGILVTALCPGYTRTGFQARAGFKTDTLWSQTATSSTEEVAEAGYAGLMAGHRVVIPGYFNKISTFILRFMPKALILPLVAHVTHLESHH
jgi:short-subunit dehydrogenase